MHKRKVRVLYEHSKGINRMLKRPISEAHIVIHKNAKIRLGELQQRKDRIQHRNAVMRMIFGNDTTKLEEEIKKEKKKKKESEVKIDEKYMEILEEKTDIGRIPLIGHILTALGFCWQYVPMYRASYKSHKVVPFGKVTEGHIDMNLYSEMSEEDTAHELLKLTKDKWDTIVYMGIGILIGMLLGYYLMSGGLEGIIGRG